MRGIKWKRVCNLTVPFLRFLLPVKSKNSGGIGGNSEQLRKCTLTINFLRPLHPLQKKSRRKSEKIAESGVVKPTKGESSRTVRTARKSSTEGGKGGGSIQIRRWDRETFS